LLSNFNGYRYNEAGEFTFDKITDKSISWQEIVTEVPVKISNSALVSAVMVGLCSCCIQLTYSC
jgi:hypothetical protein